MAGTADVGELWQAEFRWLSRVERDGFELMHRPRFGPGPTIGAAAVLAADAWRCRAALESPPAVADRWRSTMPWPEAMAPVRMERIAVLAPSDTLRDALVLVADAGVVQFDAVGPQDDSAVSEAAQRLQRFGSTHPTPMLSAVAPDLEELEHAGRADLLAGEARLDERAAAAVHRDDVAALTGWCPAPELDALAVGLGSVAAAVVPLPRPPGVDPPTLLEVSGWVARSRPWCAPSALCRTGTSIRRSPRALPTW